MYMVGHTGNAYQGTSSKQMHVHRRALVHKETHAMSIVVSQNFHLNTTMDKKLHPRPWTKSPFIDHSRPTVPNFAEMKLVVLSAVLPKTEKLKMVIVALTVPRLSLAITMDKKKIRMLFLYHNSQFENMKFL